jgi:hypothetical protein
VGYRSLARRPDAAPEPRAAEPPASATSTPPRSTAEAVEAAHQGFLYGRVITQGGDTYEGRLRWGDGEEAFWGDFFNGVERENAWSSFVPPERLPTESSSFELFGLEIGRRTQPADLARPFVTRFGDIARIEAQGRDVLVTLKSGTVHRLDRHDASDFDDGVRVWDGTRGDRELGPRQIRVIELLPTARLAEAPRRLHGTVRTAHGEFSGFVQWNRAACVGTDELRGRTGDEWLALHFDDLRSIARRSNDGALVTLVDGRELALSDSPEINADNRGVYVDDRRFGRVLVSWDAFERIDFDDEPPAGSGPAYGDFPPGQRLTGSVGTRDGRRLAGRLVFDLDESESTELLDAPAQGVDYSIPLGLVAALAIPAGGEGDARRIRATLHGGGELELEPAGDLGDGNAGLLVFGDEGARPEYVPWNEVERVDFERPPSMYPPLEER